MSQSAANADQIAQWNGPSGEKWARHQGWLDRMLAEIGEAIVAAAAPQPGDHIVDIGCGAGETSLKLAAAAGPGGSVLGVDVSEPLLAVARARAEGHGAVRFMHGDASAYAFPPNSADLVFSRFGVMFFDHPEAAFRNIRGALKPGGRLAFVCWRAAADNPLFLKPMGVLARHIEMPAVVDPYAPGPTAFADEARTCAMLERAGFRQPMAAALEAAMVIGKDPTEAADHMMEIGPAARAIVEQPPAVASAIRDGLVDAFKDDMGAAGVVLPARCWIITAEA